MYFSELISETNLCLNVVSSDDVSDGSQSRRGHLVVCVPAERSDK